MKELIKVLNIVIEIPLNLRAQREFDAEEYLKREIRKISGTLIAEQINDLEIETSINPVSGAEVKRLTFILIDREELRRLKRGQTIRPSFEDV